MDTTQNAGMKEALPLVHATAVSEADVRGSAGGLGGRYVRGAWSSGLFSCTADWCSLFTVLFCAPITTAQLYTRFSSHRGKTVLFLSLALFLLLGQILPSFAPTPIKSNSTNEYADSDEEVRSILVTDDAVYVEYESYTEAFKYQMTPLRAFFAAWAFIASLCTLLVVCQVRRKIRVRDQIPEEQCGGCEDFCCSLWCINIALSLRACHARCHLHSCAYAITF